MILINSSSRNALKIFQPFLSVFVPVGIGYLAAFAQKNGIKVSIIDEHIEKNVFAVVAEHVKMMEKPYIFGFSVVTAAFKNAITVSKKLKEKYPDSIILFGGIHPTALPDEVLAYSHIDLVIRGEAEESLVEFYKCIKHRTDFTRIPNVSYKKDGRIFHNTIIPLMVDFNDLPDFPYHLFESKQYDLGFVVSSRGCPYRCIFCSNRVTTGKKYRYYPEQRIIKDLKLLYEKYHQKNIAFLDDNLLVNKDRIYNLIDGIKSAGLDKKIKFGFQARGDNVNYKILKDMYDCGFKNVFFGLETASEEIMKYIKKDETVEECVKAVKLAQKIGFHVSATFIYGLPGDSHFHRMNCLKLSKNLRLDMVRYNNATPYPGTELYKIAESEGKLVIKGLYDNFSSVSVFIENPFRKIPFSYVPKNNSEDDIRNDTLYSYFSFYFNMAKLTSIFKHPEKSGGWFNAGESVIELIKKIPALLLLSFFLVVKFYILILGKFINFIIGGILCHTSRKN